MTNDDEEWPKYPDIKIKYKKPVEEAKVHDLYVSPEIPNEKKGLFGSVFGLVRSVFEKEKDSYKDP